MSNISDETTGLLPVTTLPRFCPLMSFSVVVRDKLVFPRAPPGAKLSICYFEGGEFRGAPACAGKSYLAEATGQSIGRWIASKSTCEQYFKPTTERCSTCAMPAIGARRMAFFNLF